jgi:DNA-binding MarR family transcriptional regulator
MSAAVAVPAPPEESRELFERRLRTFFERRGVDLDAQAVAFGLFRAQADVFSAIERAALRPLGLTHAGFVLLMSIWTIGPLETRRLALALGVSRPSVVSVVNTLERRGFVRRVRSTLDRRLVTVELTAEGERLVADAQHETHRYERRLVAGMGVQEQRTLARLLKKLEAAAREMLDESGGTSRRRIAERT